ncbi:MAG: hypothetical protein D4R64_00910 [Porphyromonadaceae bacterium]|nr:MAG: hypothetical protein D4R64_00910 [Porphyromonadaceae bacterium]
MEPTVGNIVLTPITIGFGWIWESKLIALREGVNFVVFMFAKIGDGIVFGVQFQSLTHLTNSRNY